jgi:hypothetical protein
MYFIAYVLFYLELPASQICGHKSFKDLRKPSKDYITDSLYQRSSVFMALTQKTGSSV